MAHPDLNILKDSLLPVAQRMLTEHGEFFPYGAFMKQNGEIVNCSPFDGDEHPLSQRLIDILIQDFRLRATKGEMRAAGICVDVRVVKEGQQNKIDAIQFELEHQNGEAVNVYLPYDLDSSGEVRYGKLFATKREQVFLEVTQLCCPKQSQNYN